MSSKRFALFLFLLYSGTSLMAQSKDIRNNNFQYNDFARQLFDESLYVHASRYSELFKDEVKLPYLFDFQNLIQESDVIKAISEIRTDRTGSESELTKVIQEQLPHPSAIPAVLELGSYYYNKNLYKKTIETYELIDLNALVEYDMSEASFKKGYAHFVLKEFESAEEEFSRIKEIKNEYYYPSNYYYGMCKYFTKDHDAAVSSFKKVLDSDVYNSFVPYYIAQIHFAKNEPEKVISYAESALKNANLRNRKEIRLLLGQSYFKLNNFEKALPHLEYYEANTEKLTVEEFYQVGFTHYQMGNCNGAINSFKELTLLDSKLGQVVNYYLADCYYKLGDVVSARAAFKKVSNMPFDKGMQDEATFNYGKLSAEAGFEREAINTLTKMDTQSPYYTAGQNIIIELLENTGDFRGAVQTIESFQKPISSKLQNIYVNQSLKYAFILYANSQIPEAITYFQKANTYHVDKKVQSQSYFWLAQIQHEKGEYATSNATLQQYFDVSNGVKLPEESSPFMGHYVRGYNMLEMKSFDQAELSFKNAIVGINLIREDIKNTQILTAILPDALIRAGDCVFKRRAYEDAIVFYDQAIQSKKGNFVYAMYQKAIIEGLLGESYEKILSLMDIKKDYPNSEYADDALYQLGLTYFDLANMDNAYSAFSEMHAKYPKSNLINDAQLKAGLIAYNKGDLTSATMHYKNVMANNPNAQAADGALIGLQEIYIKDLGQSEEYMAYLSTIPGYSLDVNAADSLNFKVGELRFLQGEYDKAVEGLSTYISKFPNGVNRFVAHYYRAESYSVLKKFQSALEDYEKVLEFGASDYYQNSIKKAAIIAYNSTQSYSKAYKYYDAYYKDITDNQEKYQAALGALRSAFRISNAEGVKLYSKVIVDHPLSSPDDKGAALYYDGKLKFAANDLVGATNVLTRVPKYINNNQAAESRYLLAEIAFKQKDINLAETLANAANEANALYPYWIAKSLILLSDIYVTKKDFFNARAALEAVIENFKDDTALITSAQEKLRSLEELEKQNSRIKNVSGNTLELLPGN
ncbi:MAG: tetratricopeptide repeat protein [Saprospiraceae bacterium]